MAVKSAGILLFRNQTGTVEVLLAHPGGPFWSKKDNGSWSVPKGEYLDSENPLDAARREFKEETGIELSGSFYELTPVRRKSGKVISVWCLQGDADPEKCVSNVFKLEWPPKSGNFKEFPEVDKVEWFPLESARLKILPGQLSFLLQFATLYNSGTFNQPDKNVS